MKVEFRNCKYGPMVFLDTDLYVGQSLLQYGEYCEGEVEVFRSFIQKGWTVMDIGANFGALTVPMGQLAGRIISIEPQPSLYGLLVANAALTGLGSKFTGLHAAVGKEARTVTIPTPNYASISNFGAVPATENGPGTSVKMITIDGLVAQGIKPQLIKIDVEGWEEDVLRGGEKYIKEFNPILYVENDKPEKAVSLVNYILDELGYAAYWHISPLFNPRNYRNNPNNTFGNVCSFNLVCVPPSAELETNLTRVTKENALPPIAEKV